MNEPEQFYFFYKTTSGECKEGPYSMEEALKRKLDFGFYPSCEPRIELEEKKCAAP